MVTLNILLKHSDAISLHITHEPQNKNLIGQAKINQMKPGVIIVNTADREIINEEPLPKPLNRKKFMVMPLKAKI